MSHPSLGLPPPDTTAGDPAAAARIRAASGRLAARALEIAIEGDAGLVERHDEVALRQLLRDAETFIDRIALAVATGDAAVLGSFIDQLVPLYRRRQVSMDDVARLLEGLRASIAAVLIADEGVGLHAAIDAGIAQTRWNRRIAGDARKRNRLLQFLYKGA